MNNLRIIIGPPGTGKTSYLKRQIERAAEKYDPSEIVACSYTKGAVRELCHRDLPMPDENIGTLHSIGYRALGCPDLVETSKGIKEFVERYSKWLSLFTGSYESEIDDIDVTCPALTDINLLRSLKRPIHLWDSALQHAYAAWCAFKKDREAIDYCDMIDLPLQQRLLPASRPRIMFVDEAQDCTPLETDLIHFWGADTDQYFLVGDADQSIFSFKGAVPGTLNISGVENRVLSQSWRVPQTAHNIAQQIIRRNDGRVNVQYRSTDAPGSVQWHEMSIANDDVAELATSLDGNVMILATCGYMLRDVISSLRRRGLPYQNSFRRKRLDWNPLWQSAKKSANVRMISRINAFAKGPNWTAADLLLWEPLTKGVFGKNSREILRDLPTDLILTASQLADLMGEDHAGAAIFDDFQWLRQNLNKKSQDQCEYYLKLMDAHPKGYHEQPNITVGTIHSVKGGETDHVIISPDISFQAQQSGNWGEINRVFYVGVTRTRDTLHLLAPSPARNRRFVSPHIQWPESLTS
jgi:DNA helicase II / ATP-dependent DNA helicase PcrA